MTIAGTAVMRAADAMLRGLGGDQVQLVLPAATVPTDPNSQLGLSEPDVQQIVIYPVVVRRLPVPQTGPVSRIEFLLSASAVANAVDAEGLGSAEDLFNSILGIRYQSTLFHIEHVTTDYFAGTVYLYHVIAVE